MKKVDVDASKVGTMVQAADAKDLDCPTCGIRMKPARVQLDKTVDKVTLLRQCDSCHQVWQT